MRSTGKEGASAPSVDLRKGIPNLTLPSYIESKVGYFDPWAHTATRRMNTIKDEYPEVVDEVEEVLSMMAEYLSYVKVPVDLPNGRYILERNGNISKEYSPYHRYEDVILQISLKYIEQLSTIIKDFGSRALETEIERLYEEGGGAAYYISIPSSIRDIRYFEVIVDEGIMYTIGYQYDQ